MKMKVWRILFWWLYREMEEHFHQWPPAKAVRMLQQEKNHATKAWIEGNKLITKMTDDEITESRRAAPHIESAMCWCEPDEIEPGLFVHKRSH